MRVFDIQAAVEHRTDDEVLSRFDDRGQGGWFA